MAPWKIGSVMLLASALGFAAAQTKCAGGSPATCSHDGSDCVQFSSALPLMFNTTCGADTDRVEYSVVVPVCLDGLNTGEQLSQFTLALADSAKSIKEKECTVHSAIKTKDGWSTFANPLKFSTKSDDKWTYAMNVVLTVALKKGVIYSKKKDGKLDYEGSGWATTCEDHCLLSDEAPCITSPGAPKVCATTSVPSGAVWPTFFVVFSGTDVNGHSLTSSNSNPLNFRQFSASFAASSLFGNLMDKAKGTWSDASSQVKDKYKDVKDEGNKINPT